MSVYRRRGGQAATELAVFGAVLIFLIGSIVRNGVNSGQQQNVQLKAMRQALLQSYTSSTRSIALDATGGTVFEADGITPKYLPHTGRSSSSIVYFEDRLSPDISRYGNSDRMELAASGSGSVTNLLFYPLDPAESNDPKNLPTSDYYVNGVHLPITTAAIRTIVFAAPAPIAGRTIANGWNFECVKDAGGNWLPCPLFYNISSKAGDFGVLSGDEPYDLNRNDNFADDPKAGGPGKLPREQMMWHWKAENAILATTAGMEVTGGGGVCGSATAVDGASTGLTIDPANNQNTVFDVDNDGQEETIYDVKADPLTNIITQVTVMDSQEGDLDPTVWTIFGRVPGFQRDMSILTKSRPGTYFEIREGKLYNPETGQYSRTISFRDQVEVIQRMFQLTKNTGRFCSAGGVLAAKLPDNSANPIEACGSGGGGVGPAPGGSSCFSAENINKTCMDTDSLIIYIRSRVLDKTGHLWLSDTTGKLPL